MDSTVQFESNITFLDRHFSLMGFQLFDDSWNGKYRRLHRYFVFILFVLQPITAFIHLYDNFSTSTLAQTAFALGNAFVCIQSILKMIFILFYYKDMRILIQASRAFRASNSQNADFSGVISRYTRMTKILLKCLHVCYFLALVLLMIAPFVTGEYKQYVLPVMFHIPFLPLDVPSVYVLNYAYQLRTGISAVYFAAGMDGLLVLSISEACMQLDVFKKKLETLGSNDEGLVRTRDAITTIKTIFDFHVDLLCYITHVQTIFAKLVLIQYGCSCLSACMLMYATTRSSQAAELQSTYVFLFAVIFQLLVYCGFGQFLTNKVHDLTTALYESTWYNLTLKDQKSLLMIMSRSQKGAFIGALGLHLSIHNFIMILKTAYSYYAVMQKIDA